MRRLDDQEKQLDYEIDDIDAEFKSLFSKQMAKQEKREKEQTRAGFADVGLVQFSAVQEESVSDADADRLAAVSEDSEYERERAIIMEQLARDR